MARGVTLFTLINIFLLCMVLVVLFASSGEWDQVALWSIGGVGLVIKCVIHRKALFRDERE